jgi:hypothetical protein
MLTSVIVPLALAASALANVFITFPVFNSSLSAGQQTNVSWIDSGSGPSLSQFGLATFAIYVGNANEQTLLQAIASSIDVANMTSLVFTPLASIGPDSDEYFIRITSQSLKNPNATQYFEEAFSAKFALTGMSGSFNSSVQAEINGQSTAPIGGPTGTAASPTGSATGTSSSASPSSTNGAAKPIVATSFVALAAALVGASLM